MRVLPLILLCLFAQLLQAQQPNILLIIADDLGLDPVPGYLPGLTKAAMPHLQDMMNDGITFDNVWVNPVCSPTRATAITGRYSNKTNVLNATTQSELALSETTLFEFLDSINSPYASSVIGKWHLGGAPSSPNNPAQQGVAHYTGLISGGASDYSSWTHTTNGSAMGNNNYITKTFTDSAAAWIDRQNQPWFCWLAYTAPHVPFHLPPTFMHNQGALPTDSASIASNPLPYYMAMIESLDYEMGRLFDSIGASQMNNTIVIFIGDNGTDKDVIQSPYSSQQGKGSLYQGGVHVPMVISGTGVTRSNEREAALVNSTDLFTTIVELSGHGLPVYEDSRSMVPIFTQQGIAHRTCLRADVGSFSAGHTIRNAQYKLISFDSGSQEMYDLVNDPYEANDLLLNVLSPTEQTAFLELSGGCSVVQVPETARQELIRVHPNPSNGELFVNAANNSSYQVISTAGRLVATGSVQDGAVDVSELANGLYLLAIKGVRIRFVKEN